MNPDPINNLNKLLIRIAKRDDDALIELYNLTKYDVYGYALSILKNAHICEDIIQDTYLKIMKKAHTYKGIGKAKSWILSITRNLCLMELRKHKNKDLSFDELELDNFLKSSSDLDMTEELILRNMFETLSLEERQIVSLHLLSGFKHKEIAEFMDIPLSTILSKYNRALKKLKMKWEES